MMITCNHGDQMTACSIVSFLIFHHTLTTHIPFSCYQNEMYAKSKELYIVFILHKKLNWISLGKLVNILWIIVWYMHLEYKCLYTKRTLTMVFRHVTSVKNKNNEICLCTCSHYWYFLTTVLNDTSNHLIRNDVKWHH